MRLISFERPSFTSWILLCLLAALAMAPEAGAQDLPLPGEPAEPQPPSRMQQTIPLDPVPDNALESRIETVLRNVEAFRNVSVAVRDGVVRLSGNTPTARARERVESLVSRFEGVLYVENAIEQQTEVESRLAPAVDRIEQYLNQAVGSLPVFGVAVIVILIFWLLSRFLSWWEAPFRKLRVNPLLSYLIRQTIRSVVFLIGILLAIDILDITALVGAIVGTAGVVGIALGFAFKDIVENYLAGVILSLRSPFAVNDLVHIGDQEGKVIRLTSRELILMTLDGNHVVIPNATVFRSNIFNYSRNPRRRFQFDIGIGSGEDLLRVQEIGIRTLRAMKGTIDDPGPFMRVEQLGDWNVSVRFFGWIDQREADWFKVKSEAIRLVKAALDAEEIAMPAPISTIRIGEAEEDETAPVRQPPEFSEVEASAERADVSVDTQLDRQIEEDLAEPGRENLLSGRGGKDRRDSKESSVSD